MLLPSTFNTIPTWFLPIPENKDPALGVVDLSNLSGCATTNSLDTGEMSVEQKRINNA